MNCLESCEDYDKWNEDFDDQQTSHDKRIKNGDEGGDERWIEGVDAGDVARSKEGCKYG